MFMLGGGVKKTALFAGIVVAGAVAALVLGVASVVVLVGASPSSAAAAAVGLVVLALCGLVVAGRGRVPFLAAVAIALVDAVLLVVAR